MFDYIFRLMLGITNLRAKIGDKFNSIKLLLDNKANINGSNIPTNTIWYSLRAGGLTNYTFTDTNVGGTFQNIVVQDQGGMFLSNNAGVRSWLGLGDHRSKTVALAQSYRRTVIPLCLLDNANASLDSYFVGDFYAKRNNGLVAVSNKATINAAKIYNETNIAANVTYQIHPNTIFFRPVTFTYNGSKYFGMEVGSAGASFTFAVITGFASDWTFINPIDYYNTQNNTAINAEINNSIAEYTYTSDLANKLEKSLNKIEAEAFIKRGGTNTNILLDGGDVKPISDFALPGDNVPYTGANKSVDLGTQNLTIGGVFRKNTATLEWNDLGAGTSSTNLLRKYWNVASYVGTRASTNAGVVRIVIPINASSMWNAQISIQEYIGTLNSDPRRRTTLTVGAYSTGNAASFVMCDNPDRIEKVAFGRDTANSNTILLIYPKTTAWSYEEVTVDWVQQAHSYASGLHTKSNYVAGFVATTDLPALDFTLNNEVLNAGFQRDSFYTGLGVSQFNITYATNVYTFSVLLNNGVQKQATLQVSSSHFEINPSTGVLQLLPALATQLVNSFGYVRGLTSTDNLDNITGIGLYMQTTSANATLALNYPIAGNAGLLKVYKSASTHMIQEYTPFINNNPNSSTGNRTYQRYFYNGIISSWRQIAYVGDNVSSFANDANYLTAATVGNGQLTVNTTGDIVGSYVFSANQTGNTTVTLGLSTNVLNAIVDGKTAYSWGNHAAQGYLKIADLNGYATQAWVNSQISNIPAPGNGTVILQGIGALTGTATFSMNQSNNVVGSFDLTPQIKSDIQKGADIANIFKGVSKYHQYIDASGGGSVNPKGFLFVTIGTGGVPVMNIDVQDHDIDGARVILEGNGGGGTSRYNLNGRKNGVPTLFVELETNSREIWWDANIGAYRMF